MKTMISAMLRMKFSKLVKDYTMVGVVRCMQEYLVKYPTADYDEELAVELNKAIENYETRRQNA